MITIHINNHKSNITGDPKVINLIRKRTRIRKPGYFFSEAFRSRKWDGYINYITEVRGEFYTGMLGIIMELAEEFKEKVIINDNRKLFKHLHDVSELGDKQFRGYQKEAINSLLNHRLYGVKYERGILNEATNAGKNLIAAGIIKSYSKKRKVIFLIHNKAIHAQAVKELEELLPGEIGEISTRRVEWNRVMVCMVQTVCSRVKNPEIHRGLLSMDICIVDECHRAATSQYGNVLKYLYNTTVRLGMSGTPLKHKDKTKNMSIINFFGPVIHAVSNRELVDQGFSTPPKISFFLGNNKKREGLKYKEEYDKCITYNKKRNRKIWSRVQKNIDRERFPIFIIVRYRDHIKELLKALPEEIKDKYEIRYIDGRAEDKYRDKIVNELNKGKIDILISSMIFKEGMNLPKIRTLINAAAGDSEISVLQIFGRGLRKDDNKERIYIEDFFDLGRYLQRHSKHRIIYYKNQKFKVHEYYKKTI